LGSQVISATQSRGWGFDQHFARIRHGHRFKLHDESTFRTFRNNGNAESEESSVEQFGRQPWSELQLARELQAEMLPDHPEAGRDLAAKCSAAQTVGGDFYDFFRYPAKAITAQALGDASGKGASAAIYAALAAGILPSLAPLELRPAEMLWTLNGTLLKRPIRGRYVCVIYATWDERDRVFSHSECGSAVSYLRPVRKTFFTESQWASAGTV
jgi:serine phosphatase RsbU (regulator of sigma subunit)